MELPLDSCSLGSWNYYFLLEKIGLGSQKGDFWTLTEFVLVNRFGNLTRKRPVHTNNWHIESASNSQLQLLLGISQVD